MHQQKQPIQTALCKALTLAGCIATLGQTVGAAQPASTTQHLQLKDNNWEGSLILQGVYYHSDKDDDHHEHGDEHDHDHGHGDDHDHGSHDHGNHDHGHMVTLPGFPAGSHQHSFKDGLQAGHIEAVVSGNITPHLNARVTTAMLDTDHGLEVELEEAFVESASLGYGTNIKLGRFFSDIGYLSSKHNHEWDFSDTPLVYEGMFGSHTNDDGLQFSVVAPTDTFMQFGVELFKGDKFPANDSGNTIGASSFFAKVGGDIGTDHSWQAGIGHWRAGDVNNREGALHEHPRPDGSMHSVTPEFSGDSKINTVGAVYKWAPNGNPKERNFTLQGEYFQRDEGGDIAMIETQDGSTARQFTYNGEQYGWYVQGVYQFRPHWRVGLRHDRLGSDNRLSNPDGSAVSEHALSAAGLADHGHDPKRNTVMVDYSPREYSRWRLQYNQDERQPETDHQVILEYTHSFGSHGAHSF